MPGPLRLNAGEEGRLSRLVENDTNEPEPSIIKPLRCTILYDDGHLKLKPA
jgi:hypothetical protein